MIVTIQIDGKIYKARDLLGLTLFASKNVVVTDFPADGEDPIRVIAPGNPIGQIDTWVEPKPGRTNAWFQYQDHYGNFYYTEIKNGMYSRSAIDQQIEMNQTQINDPIGRVGQLVTTSLITWGGIKIISALLNRR